MTWWKKRFCVRKATLVFHPCLFLPPTCCPALTLSPPPLPRFHSFLSQLDLEKQADQSKGLVGVKHKGQPIVSQLSIKNRVALKQAVVRSPPIWVKWTGTGTDSGWRGRPDCFPNETEESLSRPWCVCVCLHLGAFYSCFYCWQGQGVIL